MMQKIREKLPEIFVILLCMLILALGVAQKEGYHMDELLSFELANAEFNPWIVPTQPEGRLAKFVHNEIDGENIGEVAGNLLHTFRDVLQNKGNSVLLSYTADVYEEPVWITARQFQDYITVDGKDAFNYVSVYFNVKDDNHPPLHFMLLHTVSSLFWGQLQPFMGCVINMAAVALTMWLLMQLGRLLAEPLGMPQRGRLLGIVSALLYGISTGALASVLLIRMYCVMTCFCVALLYFHVKKWQREEFHSRNKALIAITVLGFWTQYFFLFYCLVLAAVTAVLLMCYQRKRELWCYIRSMVGAAVIGLVGFPFAILDVFSSERGVEALGNLSAGLAGYGTRIASFWSILKDRTFQNGLVVFVVLGLICLGYVFRKGQRQKLPYLFMVLLPVAGYFLLAARMSPYLVDRYIMALFPFVNLTGALVLVGVGTFLENKKQKKGVVTLICGIVVALQCFLLTQYNGDYLYRGYHEQEALARQYAEYPCICVYDGVGYYENLLELAQYDRTLLVTQEQLTERKEVSSIEALEQVVVLIKQNVDALQICDVMQDKYGFAFDRELLDNSVYGDTLCLFTKEGAKE